MIVTVVGARGFVGSAFAHHLTFNTNVELRQVTRNNYGEYMGRWSDVVIDCSGNSFKHVAEARPQEDFERSVRHRLDTILHFPADLQVHISSIDVTDGTNYGFHKHLTDEIVEHYCPRYLTLHLSGMVGPGMHKNPVYDILNDIPIWIHPDSQQQFIYTSEVARIGWQLVEMGVRQTAINICGEGGISPKEIAVLSGKVLDCSRPGVLQMDPRYWVCPVEVLKTYIGTVPRTYDTIRDFVWRYQAQELQRG